MASTLFAGSMSGLIQRSDWSSLASILRKQLDTEEAETVGLLHRLGNLHEEKLDDASGAVEAYKEEVESGRFPAEEHIFSMPKEEFEKI